MGIFIDVGGLRGKIEQEIRRCTVAQMIMRPVPSVSTYPKRDEISVVCEILRITSFIALIMASST